MDVADIAHDEVDYGNGVVGKAILKTWSQFRRMGKAKDTDKPLEVKEEILEVRRFATAPAKVSYWNSAKINVGNFESLDVGVSISMPCYTEEIDDALQYVQDKVEVRMKGEVDAVRQALVDRR